MSFYNFLNREQKWVGIPLFRKAKSMRYTDYYYSIIHALSKQEHTSVLRCDTTLSNVIS